MIPAIIRSSGYLRCLNLHQKMQCEEQSRTGVKPDNSASTGAKIKGTLLYSMTYGGKLAVLILSVLGSNLVLTAQAKELPKQPGARKHHAPVSTQKNKPS